MLWDGEKEIAKDYLAITEDVLVHFQQRTSGPFQAGPYFCLHTV